MSDPMHTFLVEEDGSVRIEMPSGVGIDVDARGTSTSRIIAAAIRQLLDANARALAANRALSEAAAILKQHNAWRRWHGDSDDEDRPEPVAPHEIGQAIDIVVAHIEATEAAQ